MPIIGSVSGGANAPLSTTQRCYRRTRKPEMPKIIALPPTNDSKPLWGRAVDWTKRFGIRMYANTIDPKPLGEQCLELTEKIDERIKSSEITDQVWSCATVLEGKLLALLAVQTNPIVMGVFQFLNTKEGEEIFAAWIHLLMLQAMYNVISSDRTPLPDWDDPRDADDQTVKYMVKVLTRLAAPLKQFETVYAELESEKPENYDQKLFAAIQQLVSVVFSALFVNGTQDLHLPKLAAEILNWNGIGFEDLKNKILPELLFNYFKVVEDVVEILPLRDVEVTSQHPDLDRLASVITNAVFEDNSPRLVGYVPILSDPDYHFLNRVLSEIVTDKDPQLVDLKAPLKQRFQKRVFSYLLTLWEKENFRLSDATVLTPTRSNESNLGEMLKILLALVNSNQLGEKTLDPLIRYIDQYVTLKGVEAVELRRLIKENTESGVREDLLKKQKHNDDCVDWATKLKLKLQVSVQPLLKRVDHCTKMFKTDPVNGLMAQPFTEQFALMVTTLMIPTLRDIVKEKASVSDVQAFLRSRGVNVDDDIVQAMCAHFHTVIAGEEFQEFLQSILERGVDHVFRHLYKSAQDASLRDRQYLSLFFIKAIKQAFEEAYPAIKVKIGHLNGVVASLEAEWPYYDSQRLKRSLADYLSEKEIEEWLDITAKHQQDATPQFCVNKLVLMVLKDDVVKLLQGLGMTEDFLIKTMQDKARVDLSIQPEISDPRLEVARAASSVIYHAIVDQITVDYVFRYQRTMLSTMDTGRKVLDLKLPSKPEAPDRLHGLINEASPLVMREVRRSLCDETVLDNIYYEVLCTPDTAGNSAELQRTMNAANWVRRGTYDFLKEDGNGAMWGGLDLSMENFMSYFSARVLDYAPHLGVKTMKDTGVELKDRDAFFKMCTYLFRRVIKEKGIGELFKMKPVSPEERAAFYQQLSDRSFEVFKHKLTEKENDMPLPEEWQGQFKKVWDKNAPKIMAQIVQPWLDPMGRDKALTNLLVKANASMERPLPKSDLALIDRLTAIKVPLKPRAEDFVGKKDEYAAAMRKYQAEALFAKKVLKNVMVHTVRNGIKSAFRGYWEHVKEIKNNWLDRNIDVRFITKFSQLIDKIAEWIFLKVVLPLVKIAFFPFFFAEQKLEQLACGKLVDIINSDQIEKWCQWGILIGMHDIIHPDFPKTYQELLKGEFPEEFKKGAPSEQVQRKLSRSLFSKDLLQVSRDLANLKIGKMRVFGGLLTPIRILFNSKVGNVMATTLAEKSQTNSRDMSPIETAMDGLVFGLTEPAA